jgi:uncharacterized protein YvpB
MVGQRMETKSNVSFLLERAEIAARQGQRDEARRLLKAVLRHDPKNEQALLWMIYLAEDGQRSLDYLARLLEIRPHHPQARSIIRWVQQRVPTSTAAEAPAVQPDRPSRHGLWYSLALIGLLVVVGILWLVGRSPAATAQADAAPTVTLPESAQFPSDPPAPTDPAPTDTIPTATAPAPAVTSTPTLVPSSPTPTSTAPPKSAWVPVLGHPQSRNLSCESRSATDLARYWDVTFDELEFLATLGQSDNPHRGFVGDVDMPAGSLPPVGYGVYAEPVAATLRQYGLNARFVYDFGLDGIRQELLAGRPVLVWATYNMELYEPIEWTSQDGRTSTVVPYMHTFLVTGFDESGVYVLDAYDATVQYYRARVFLDAWNLFDQMTVTVNGLLP